tara:strand:+ start:229 stop:1014 length:786 start_codon:yes stop_codon:yes gene_type:complete
MNDFLQNLNSHERDKHITFDEGPHIYTIDGSSDYISVTTWVHSFFRKFDSDEVIDKMMKSKNWIYNKYYGKSKETIKQEWDDNRDDAARKGTQLHFEIETFYNKVEEWDNIPEIDSTETEVIYFKNFYNDHLHLTAYRTEWMIYDKELKIAGSIDMVFKEQDGTLSIYDWKRSKEIIQETRYNEYSIDSEINYIPDTNYWHYSLQLNIYKALLERNYDVKISSLYLVRLHPNSDNYEKIRVVNLQDAVKKMFDVRIKSLCV